MPLFPGRRLGWLPFVLWLFSVRVFGGEGYWTSTGPQAAVSAIAVDARLAFTVIAAGNPGGGAPDAVFRTFGLGWTEQAQASQGVSLTSLVFDPSNPSTIYAAGRVSGLTLAPKSLDAGAIYVSRDAGSTWSFLHLFPNAPVVAIAVDPQDSSILYVAGSICFLFLSAPRCGEFVSRSGDGGGTWSSSLLSPSAGSTATSMAINPKQPSRLYVGTDCGLLYSGDSGASWTGFFGSPFMSAVCRPIRALAINPEDPETVYVGYDAPPPGCGFFCSNKCGFFCTEHGGLAVSRNGGDGWVRTDTISQVQTLIVDPAYPNVLYASGVSATGLSGVLRTQDGAMSWSKVGDLDGANELQLDSRRRVIYAATPTGVFEYEDTPLASPHVLPNGRNVRRVLPRQ